jgi:hypothetical protein
VPPGYIAVMKRTVIELDEDLLAEAIESVGGWFAENPFDKDDAWR